MLPTFLTARRARLLRGSSGWDAIERGAGMKALLPASLGAIVAVDVLLKRIHPGLVALAVLDESAHVATTFLLSRSLRRAFPSPLLVGLLAGSVLIDLDHLPHYLGRQSLRPKRGRPHTHSLSTVGGLGILAGLLPGAWGRVALGCMFGVAAHLVRDMATGGVPLWWPITRSGVRMPYAVYTTLLLTALSRAIGTNTQTGTSGVIADLKPAIPSSQ